MCRPRQGPAPLVRPWGPWALGLVAVVGLALAPQACDTPPRQLEVGFSGESNVLPADPQRALPLKTCAGAPPDCNTLTDPNVCGLQNGCGWVGAYCYPPSCGDYNDQTTCEAMACQWAELCGGTPQSCTKSRTEGACNVRPGCAWVAGSSVCSGAPTYCAALDGDPTTCATHLGCRADVRCVEVGSVRCQDFSDPDSCRAGPRCAWQDAACGGSALPCGVSTDPNTCGAQQGCRWVDANQSASP